MRFKYNIRDNFGGWEYYLSKTYSWQEKAKRVLCFLLGGHKFDENSLEYPTPLRPKVCQRCSAIWRVGEKLIPPPLGKVLVECKHCRNVIYCRRGQRLITCDHCGANFTWKGRI